MARSTAIMATSVLLAILLAFTVLLALGRDVEQLTDIVITAIIPTAVVFFVGNKVDKVAHNTNGRMTELTENNAALAQFIREKMPESYAELPQPLKDAERVAEGRVSSSEYKKALRKKRETTG